MKAWILSVCGVAFLGLMIDVVAPLGKMNKFIKSTFSIFFIFILASPILGLFQKDIKIPSMTYEIDQNLLNIILEQKLSSMEQRVSDALIDGGFSEINVVFEGIMQNNELVVKKVCVNTTNEVLKRDLYSINNVNKITEIIVGASHVDKEVIVFE